MESVATANSIDRVACRTYSNNQINLDNRTIRKLPLASLKDWRVETRWHLCAQDYITKKSECGHARCYVAFITAVKQQIRSYFYSMPYPLKDGYW